MQLNWLHPQTLSSVKFRLVFYLLFISIFSFAQSPNHVHIPGTLFYMIPPADFEIAKGFNGFLHQSSGAFMMVNEIEAPYSKVLEKFSKKELENKGMTWLGQQDLQLNNSDATLITATQLEDGIENYKKMLLFGDGEMTLLVTAVYPDSNPELGASIKRAMLSTIYKRLAYPKPRIPSFDNEQGIASEDTSITRRVSIIEGRRIVESFYKSGKQQSFATFSDEALKIKDGIFKRWYENGKLADSNIYMNGKLEGYQVWFHENGQKSEEGTYADGEPKNVSFWIEDGAPDPKGFSGEKFPSFKGDINSYLAKNLKYPKSALDHNQTGKCYIQFEITVEGKIVNAGIFRSSGVPALDKEALRVISIMPDWNPGSDHNRRVKVKFMTPITFMMD
jgi:TonB family protein